MAKSKMKTLFWRTEFYGAITGGGVASLYDGLCGGLLNLGHEVSFASSGRLDMDNRISTHYIPYSRFFRNLPEVLCLPYNKRSVRSIKKIIELEKPDLLFQHHHDFNYGGSIIKRELGIPFFLHCDFIQLWVKENWGKLYFKKLLKWAEEIQWENADRIFVISTVVKEMMGEFGVDTNKIIVNPNGADPEVFHPDIDGSVIRKKYDIEDKFIIGFSGTFGYWHGVEVLAAAVKELLKMIPEAMVMFIGDGELRPRIENILKNDNVSNKAMITGFLQYQEVPQYLAACDVLVSPCVHSRDGSPFFNSPIKLFEYLAMGKPIVASDIGQQSEVIENGVNGFLAQERSVEDLCNQIYKIYQDNDIAVFLGKNARHDSIAKYNWTVNANRILSAYKDHCKTKENLLMPPS
jgi:glycosyltransferase involved in cell wall biosynthesis